MSSYRRIMGGYTILEVIIVLTVSTLLFSASIFAYTQQNRRTQFSDSLNSFSQDIQDVLNDVETGFYPSNNDFSCTAGVTGLPDPTGPGTSEQGTNTDCIFVGKAIQFAPHGAGQGTMDAYTVIGRRLKEGSQTEPATTIDQVKPVGLDRLVDRQTLVGGLQILSVRKADGTPLSGIAIVSNSGATGSISTGLNARPALATIDGSVNDSKATFLDHISGASGGSHLTSTNIDDAKNGINICVREGGTGGRFAVIQLASGGSQIIVNTEIDQSCS